MITNSLHNLLCWGVPKMTDEGAAEFQRLLEDAVSVVVRQAFDERELESFHVTNMIDSFRLKA